jgi:DMSO/TMAO reductase YedYZ molybdopterin-dependent catalytic subunit
MKSRELRTVDITRRRVLGCGAGLFTASALGAFVHPAWSQPKPLPQYVDWKNPDNVIIHTPTTIETKRHALAPRLVTAERDLYIRNNLPPPSEKIVADRDAWQVNFEGVNNPRAVRVGDLKKMGSRDLTMVLQCSGNGRAYFPHKPSGTPWQVGASGNVTWTGVPLRTVIEQLGGPVQGARFITGTGGEEIPAGVDPKTVMVERSVPLAALEDALLAWNLNGHPVSLAHGGPLRLIIPGYTGVNSVKYVRRVALTPQETDARIQADRYRLNPVGEKASPAHPSVWEMDVKSWINLPDPDRGPVPAGSLLIQGVAFGGMSAARSVEVSVDGGRTWMKAPFVGDDLGRYAWRQFALPVRLQPGQYTIACRATDANGNVQPEQRKENADGYSNSSWRDHALNITVT